MAHSVSLPRFSFPALGFSQRLGETLRIWQMRAQERGELARFGERDLKDIGMTLTDRDFHLAKPIWRA